MAGTGKDPEDKAVKAPRKPAAKAAPGKPAAKAAAGKPAAKAAAGKGAAGSVRKPAAPKTGAKPAAKAAPVKLALVGEALGAPVAPAQPPDSSLVIRKKEFLERVVAASGAKKPVAREVTEAVLKVLGEALAAGESLALPPLGKLRVARQLDKQGGEMLVVKIRRGESGPGNGTEKTAKAPLAEDAD